MSEGPMTPEQMQRQIRDQAIRISNGRTTIAELAEENARIAATLRAEYERISQLVETINRKDERLAALTTLRREATAALLWCPERCQRGGSVWDSATAGWIPCTVCAPLRAAIEAVE